MFAGLVQKRGRVSRIIKRQHSVKLTCKASRQLLTDYKAGGSMATDGICLTYVAKTGDTFTVDIMPETFKHIIFSECRIGDLVNLELAMATNARFGGHLMIDHVDSVAILIQEHSNESVIMLGFVISQEFVRQIVGQGSIAVNGVSLTVVSVTSGQFSVSLTPHTAKEANLARLEKDDKVNTEINILARYIQTQVTKMGGQ